MIALRFSEESGGMAMADFWERRAPKAGIRDFTWVGIFGRKCTACYGAMTEKGMSARTWRRAK